VKIILGVDDSPCSKAAIDYLARSSWPKDAEVIALSAAAPVFVGPGEAAAPMVIEQLNEGQIKYHKDVAARAEKSLRDAGFRAQGRVVHADPRTALIETAEKEKAELIVVGSHGRSGLAKLLIGSVATHVVTHAHCNVLVVKIPRAM
jgi:nucleotide-binding universal stress UspA family protein